MHTRLLDAFTDLSDGRVVDFDFGGGGFMVARKPFAFTLPETFAFRLAIRAVAPPNKLEFKLVDPAGVNVWRYRDAAFDFAADWRTPCIPSRRIDFASGPAGSGAPADIGATEIAVTAGPGGQGSLWIAALRLEDRTVYEPPRLRAAGGLPRHAPACASDGRPDTYWHGGPHPGPAWLEIDF